MFTALLLLSAAADPPARQFHFAEQHMGTQFQLTLYAPDEATAKAAAKAAFARVAELDSIMSDYRATSELNQLCRKAGGEPIAVSADLFAVLKQSQELAKRTGGAFDVTVGPLTRLWRLSRRTQRLPAPEQLAQAKELVGFDKVELDETNRTVRLTRPGMQLDLGGIAKGYTADQVLLVLKKHGIAAALVAAGGDIAVSGPPPGTAAWRIGIQPLGPGQQPQHYIMLKDGAVSTAGDLEQFVVIDGTRYSHILDPKTGLGLVGRISVTVVAPRGITADGIDTAACVLGPAKGMELVEQAGVAGLMVLEGRVITSKRWPEVSAKDK